MEGGHIVEMGLAHEVFENPKEERTRQFLSKIMNNLKSEKGT